MIFFHELKIWGCQTLKNNQLLNYFDNLLHFYEICTIFLMRREEEEKREEKRKEKRGKKRREKKREERYRPRSSTW